MELSTVSKPGYGSWSVKLIKDIITIPAETDLCLREAETLAIGRLPGRKGICLYYVRLGDTIPLAYFKGETEATLAAAVLNLLWRSCWGR